MRLLLASRFSCSLFPLVLADFRLHLAVCLSSTRFACMFFILLSTTIAAYLAVSPLFLHALACNICRIMTQSTPFEVVFYDLHEDRPFWFFDSRFLPLWVRRKQMHPRLAQSCIKPCQRQCAFCPPPPILRTAHCMLDTGATVSLKAILQAPPIDSGAFTLSLLMKCLMLSIMPFVASVPLLLFFHKKSSCCR